MGWNDYGRRFYDPAVGRFSTHDRFAEKYIYLPPYHYVDNNPVKFIDVNGDSIGVQDKTFDYANSQAFTTFANTKEGIKYLSKFAKAGQVIAGHKYMKDGAYHKKGLNLHFKAEDLEGKTRGETKASGNTITVILDNDRVFDSVNDETVDVGKIETYTKAVFSRIVTLSHETFLHGELYAQGYLTDSKFNDSNIDQAIKNNKSYGAGDLQHAQVYYNSNDKVFPGSSLKVATEANTILKLNYTSSQMEGMIWNYRGGNASKSKK